MGLLDSLVGAATNAAFGGTSNHSPTTGAQAGFGGLDPQVLMGIIGMLMNQGGGLSDILAKLQQGGLGDAAASWVGTGTNQQVSADALGSALGPDLMGMIASQLGGNHQQAAGTMADLLPGLIDHLTPQGQVPADNGLGGLGALGSLLGGAQGQGSSGLDAGDLVGMLGGMLGRR